MTEQEWRSGNFPERMLDYLLGREAASRFGLLEALGLRRVTPRPPERTASNRKLRLFACACCRRIWDYFPKKCSQVAVETAERFADGLANRDDLCAAQKEAWEVAESVAINPTEWTKVLGTGGVPANKVRNWAARAAAAVALLDAQDAAEATARAVERTALEAAIEWREEKLGAMTAGAAVRAGLLRDIFGNPFRPFALAASCLTWRDGLIPGMAATIYEERRYEDLPILADALEEAGCTDQAILRHCRSRRVHVRGCWVVDVLLGKE